MSVKSLTTESIAKTSTDPTKKSTGSYSSKADRPPWNPEECHLCIREYIKECAAGHNIYAFRSHRRNILFFFAYAKRKQPGANRSPFFIACEEHYAKTTALGKKPRARSLKQGGELYAHGYAVNEFTWSPEPVWQTPTAQWWAKLQR
jgi:hypothetical protein